MSLELDAEVARRLGPISVEHAAVDEDCGDMRCLSCGAGWRVSDDGPAECVPRYSTSIAAAWTLVEVLRKRNGFGSFEIGYATCWEAEYNGEEVGVAQAETAPEAICRAFLAATEPK